jgi:hypothetical protein
MRNSGLLLLLAGVFIFLNASNFADVIRGRSQLGFLNPKSSTSSPSNSPTTGTNPPSSGLPPIVHPVGDKSGGL